MTSQNLGKGRPVLRYREDDRGRLFRWDDGLSEWFRVLSDDDEYEVAMLAVRSAPAGHTGGGSATRPADHAGAPGPGAGGVDARTGGTAPVAGLVHDAGGRFALAQHRRLLGGQQLPVSTVRGLGWPVPETFTAPAGR